MGESGKAILYMFLFNVYFFLPFLFYSGEGILGCSLAGFFVTMFIAFCTDAKEKIGYYPLFKSQLCGAGAFTLVAAFVMAFKDVDTKAMVASCVFYDIVYPAIAFIAEKHIKKNK